MSERSRLSWFVFFAPIIVLILTRLGIEVSVRTLPTVISWIPAFIIYYLSIMLTFFIAIRYFSFSIDCYLPLSLKPIPKWKLLFWTIIIPALLPIAGFVTQFKCVPFEFFVYILIFSCINPFFEEFFWRGLLQHAIGNNTFKMFYSAGLFSFSHYFFWGYWFKSWIIIIPTVIATLIMGMLWMKFMQKEKNILYPIISHIFVDIFNLSVAVYCGLINPEHF